jgi:hypothetical protein
MEHFDLEEDAEFDQEQEEMTDLDDSTDAVDELGRLLNWTTILIQILGYPMRKKKRSNMVSGKGDKRRPSRVSHEQEEKNYKRIFDLFDEDDVYEITGTVIGRNSEGHVECIFNNDVIKVCKIFNREFIMIDSAKYGPVNVSAIRIRELLSLMVEE